MQRFLEMGALLCAVMSVAGGVPRVGGKLLPAGEAGLMETYGNLALSFEANAGQVDQAVCFVGRGRGATVFLTPAEVVLSLRGRSGERAVVRMRLFGARRDPHLVGELPLRTKSNDFLGDERGRWHRGVPHCARVRAEGVYPEVDLVFRGERRELDYDLLVLPGADPGAIRLHFAGAESIAIAGDGALIVRTAAGDLVQPRPAHGGGVDAFVTKINAAGTAIAYSTFLGGGSDDGGVGIAVDATGSAYVTGFTDSTSFAGVGSGSLQPASGGGRDAFVTKIDASGGAIVFSTFLGGSGGDAGFGIAVDGAGVAYVTGPTSSTSLPGLTASSIQPGNGGGLDAFVSEIDAAGSAILYSTFLEGSSTDYGTGVAVDGVGNVYVTGATFSSSLPGIGGGSIQPVNAGGVDAFLVKIGSAADIPAASGWGLIAMGGMTLARLRPGVARALRPGAGGIDAPGRAAPAAIPPLRRRRRV